MWFFPEFPADFDPQQQQHRSANGTSRCCCCKGRFGPNSPNTQQNSQGGGNHTPNPLSLSLPAGARTPQVQEPWALAVTALFPDMAQRPIAGRWRPVFPSFLHLQHERLFVASLQTCLPRARAHHCRRDFSSRSIQELDSWGLGPRGSLFLLSARESSQGPATAALRGLSVPPTVAAYPGLPGLRAIGARSRAQWRVCWVLRKECTQARIRPLPGFRLHPWPTDGLLCRMFRE